MVQTHVIVTYWPTARDDPAARRGASAVPAGSPVRPVTTAAMLVIGVASLSLTYPLDAFPIDHGSRFQSIARIELPPVSARQSASADVVPGFTTLANSYTAETEIEDGLVDIPTEASVESRGQSKRSSARSAVAISRERIAALKVALAPPASINGAIKRVRLERMPVTLEPSMNEVAAIASPIAVDSKVFRSVPLSIMASDEVASSREAELARGDQAVVQTYPQVRIGSRTLGAITMRTARNGSPTIHIGGLLNLMKLKLPRSDYERFSNASAARTFISLEDLRKSGIPAEISSDGGELVIG